MHDALLFLPDHPLWAWLALAALLLALEAATGSGYLLWPAGSAAITAFLTPLHLGLPLEIAIFALLTIVSTAVFRRFWPHPFRAVGPDINDPHVRIVGRDAQAAGAFTSGRGRVFVDGKEWAAELEGGGELASGTTVKVLSVLDGARLKVKAG
jgi:membrane protein implicated in regulation of membrane protease activity